ncbi:hypothetical protein A2W54_03930 [Candidatus Giovannonibacteria bacterium RIFCSPHIGHO2_02_43_13]|uniref:Uncharacterized protein n=1 Tax=Candidatus Giovannonibacteria bacterium RIFCSPHIGHO2_02_43_13 TaxID=1798330 RepID=A0A1F5WRC6_9BACT|nr:MAG: hypothetical protein A3E06_03040 [Candidatus Giovannonibacteria bacterium RIFCSPHIGHO2_12_FULL_44_42]OGF78223.1 MAG: hypothetical protein A2W54_03930 [Candidatus Giovannonibacteria bacterium RIFCSPHIGHO2_02_43_13]OGF90089.1 MAG: hypothetical protein A3I94_03145 [Candidatus Giovannonibacteria bacterium RIFCSPLOWO2_02_FULL_43_54]OGF96630.1 MAG: hypothetical protein A3H08_01685 [Candidatus Giovannonibacteria bacterium RIFCSPLOWO2_12_FULL_44_32]
MAARRFKNKKTLKKKHRNFAQMIKYASPREIEKILKRVSKIINELNKTRKVKPSSLKRPMDM